MPHNDDQLLLELHFNSVVLMEHISIKQGNYFSSLNSVIYEAFKNYRFFKKLVPAPGDWSRVVLARETFSDKLQPIETDRQMDALVTYWLRRYYLGDENSSYTTLDINVWDKSSWDARIWMQFEKLGPKKKQNSIHEKNWNAIKNDWW